MQVKLSLFNLLLAEWLLVTAAAAATTTLLVLHKHKYIHDLRALVLNYFLSFVPSLRESRISSRPSKLLSNNNTIHAAKHVTLSADPGSASRLLILFFIPSYFRISSTNILN